MPSDTVCFFSQMMDRITNIKNMVPCHKAKTMDVDPLIWLFCEY